MTAALLGAFYDTSAAPISAAAAQETSSTVSAIPEPSTLLLVVLSLALAAIKAHRCRWAFIAFFAILGLLTAQSGVRGDIFRWDNGELILSAPDAIGRALERYLERTGRTTADERRERATAEAVARAAATTQTFEGPGAMPARPMSSCPDCGSPVAHENACLVCKHCGWSRC